jgi:hypothetical protein
MVRHRCCNVIHLIYQSKIFEGHSKDYEFGLSAMRGHRQSALETSSARWPTCGGWTRRHPSSASSPMTSIAAIEL